MKKSINAYLLPAIYMHPLLTNDFTKLSKKDRKEYLQWTKNVNPGTFICLSNKNAYFSKNNDLNNIPGMVKEFHFREI